MKRLRTIEDTNKVKHEVKNKVKNEIKNKVKNEVKNEDIKEIIDFVDKPLRFEAKELINEIKTIQKDVDDRKLKFRSGNNINYDFSDYKIFKELFRELYYRQFTIDGAESKQDKFNIVLNLLKTYNPRDNKYIKAKREGKNY